MRPLPSRLQLVDGAGQLHNVRDLLGDAATLVTFWSLNTAASRMDLPKVQELAGDLERLGVPVLAVTRDAPSPEMEQFLEEHGITIPVYHDLDGTVAEAFGVTWTPEYFVLDQDGWVQFELKRAHVRNTTYWDQAFERLVRQAAALEPVPLIAWSH